MQSLVNTKFDMTERTEARMSQNYQERLRNSKKNSCRPEKLSDMSHLMYIP